MTLGPRDCTTSSATLTPELKVFTYTFVSIVRLVVPVSIQCHMPQTSLSYTCPDPGKALELLNLMAITDGCFAKQSITIARGCHSSKLPSVF